MDTNEWLNALTGGATAKEIARNAGISERTLQHQVQNGKVSVENAMKISVAYDRHPLRTLIDLGVVDKAWAHVPDVKAALRIAKDVELTDEILDRLNLANYDPIYDEPVDDLAAKRVALSQSNEQGHPSPDHEDDGTVRYWSDHDHAADSSPDEDQAREDARIDPHH